VTKDEIKDAVIEALAEYGHKCQFDFTVDEVHQINQHMASIADLGDGNLASGFNEMRENHRYARGQRRLRDRVINRIGAVVVGALCLGFLWAVWEGVVHFISKSK